MTAEAKGLKNRASERPEHLWCARKDTKQVAGFTSGPPVASTIQKRQGNLRRNTCQIPSPRHYTFARLAVDLSHPYGKGLGADFIS